MLRRIVGSALRGFVVAALVTSCGDGGGGGGGDETGPGGDEGGDGEGEPGVRDVAPSSDAEGVVTGQIAMGATDTQVLHASADSQIAGAAVSFPPGALAIDTAVTVEEGASIANAALEKELGLDGAKLAPAGPAVVVTADPPVDATTPFSVTLVTSPGASLDGTRSLIVTFLYLLADGSRRAGVLPTGDLVIDGNKIIIKTTHFGSFQPTYTGIPVATAVEKVTQLEVVTAKEAKPSGGDGGDKTAPTLVAAPNGKDIMLASTPLVLVFDEAMSTTGLETTGSLIAGAPTASVVTTTKADDSIKLTPPSAGWALGRGRQITVTARDKAGNKAAAKTLTFDTTGRIYYVRNAPAGNDANAGTAAAPVATIGRALTMMGDDPADSYIFVGKGTYLEDFTAYTGTRLLGGFPADKWTGRDPKANVTTIAGTGGLTSITLTTGGANTGNEIVLDGFTILVDGSESAQDLVVVDDASVPVTIAHNFINSTAQHSMRAIRISSSDVHITQNVLKTDLSGAGDKPSSSIGIDAASGTAGMKLVVDHNEIRPTATLTGFSAGPSNGIVAYDSSGTGANLIVDIHDNLIVANVAQDSGSASESIGIDLDGTGARIRNNTIVSLGSPQRSMAIRLTGSDPANLLYIDNNILKTNNANDEYCVQTDALESVASLRNNDLQHCTYAALFTGHSALKLAGTSYGQVTQVNSLLVNATSVAGGNLDVDPVFAAGDGNYHVTAPGLKGAGLNGKTAGWDFGGAFVDLDGVARGTSWTIGAYQ
jgi:hypothetical protein